MRRRPYSVILFDEIEKAHPDVFNMLLQILEDGILTDSQGRRVDFKNCVIIMTSNVGAKQIAGGGAGVLGFSADASQSRTDKSIHDAVMTELKNVFRPEFLNRVDDIIVFRQLTKENINEIARRMLSGLSKRVRELDFELDFAENAVSAIGNAGFDPVYGARPLRRAIQQRIEDKLSEKLLEGAMENGAKYICNYENGEFRFDKA